MYILVASTLHYLTQLCLIDLSSTLAKLRFYFVFVASKQVNKYT